MRGFAGSLAICLLSFPLSAHAQGGSPVASALRADMQRAERNLTGAAETMPADKYSFSPTKAQMSFGQLVLHVANSNNYMCATIAGSKAPERSTLKETSAKDSLVAALKASFDYCNRELANTTDAGLADSVPFFGNRKISRAGAMLDLAGDWGDHYSAAATYLRLNGLLPPTARARRGAAD